MRYEYNNIVLTSQIAELRRSVGWPGTEEDYKNPLLKSFYHVACYDGDKLIGYVDTVSNAVTDAYIQDLMVNPAYQRQGIGTELMNSVINHLRENNVYMISVIYAGQHLQQFYESFGFITMLCGQMETRKPDM